MKYLKNIYSYFNKFEICLWSFSVLLLITFFCIFNQDNVLSFCTSILGVTGLILIAKGNVLGQIIMIIFSAIYGIISFYFSYYGEMITYIGMSLPMAIIALISWVKNPFNGNKLEVEVVKLNKKDYYQMALITILVTAVFYFILKYLNTANLFVSTISITTSFSAVYLTYKRCRLYAIAYAVNDVVLIVLWSLAAFKDVSSLSLVACFAAFLANDIYAFYNWGQLQKKQNQIANQAN